VMGASCLLAGVYSSGRLVGAGEGGRKGGEKRSASFAVESPKWGRSLRGSWSGVAVGYEDNEFGRRRRRW
jgi:hypothetical protein